MRYLLFALPLILPTYLIRFQIGPFPTTLLEILILIFLLTWIIARRAQGIKNAWKNIGPWRYAIFAWLIVTAIAVLISPDKIGALGHWRAYMLEPVLVFFALADLIPLRFSLIKGDFKLNRDSSYELRATNSNSLINGIAVITILLGAFAIFQYATGIAIPHPWDAVIGRRATGFFDFPNALSLFLVPFGTLCFGLWLKNYELRIITASAGSRHSIFFDCGGGTNYEKTDKYLFLVATVFAVIGVVLAKSMGGVLALGVGMMSVLLMNIKTRKIGIILTLIGALGAGIFALSVLNTELHPKNIGDSLINSKKWSSMVRVIIWSESLNLAISHPILGTGLRSYPIAVIPYHRATWMEVFQQPHNLELMLWIETGLPGLIVFAWLCVIWIRLARKKQNSWIWIAPLIALLVHGLVDVPYFKNDLAMQFWILAALASFPLSFRAE